MAMLWKIALVITVIYYAILIVLDKKSQQAYRLKEVAAHAIGKVEIVTEKETIPVEMQPDLFGATTIQEEDTAPAMEAPETETEDEDQKVRPEKTLPEPIMQDIETAGAEASIQKQEPGVSPELTVPEIPAEASVEKSTSKVSESKEAVPKTDDEEKRNFLFGGTSLAQDARPQTLDEVVVNEELARELEGLLPKPEALEGSTEIKEKQVLQPAENTSGEEEE